MRRPQTEKFGEIGTGQEQKGAPLSDRINKAVRVILAGASALAGVVGLAHLTSKDISPPVDVQGTKPEVSIPTFSETFQHHVQGGESISHILYRYYRFDGSFHYGTAEALLREANPSIANTTTIHPNTMIEVPIIEGQMQNIPDVVTPTPAAAEGAQAEPRLPYHTVGAGDTLYGIANQYGVSAEEIMKLNDLEDPDHLVVGTKLTIPSGE